MKATSRKTKFDEKNTEAKKLKEQLDAQTKLVNELKDKGNLSDEYKSQIDKLKAENEEKDKTYKAEIQKMRKDAAIEKALAGAKVREAKAFMPYLDENKISVNDDGTVNRPQRTDRGDKEGSCLPLQRRSSRQRRKRRRRKRKATIRQRRKRRWRRWWQRR